MFRSYNVFQCTADKQLNSLEHFSAMVRDFFEVHDTPPDFSYAVYKGIIDKNQSLYRHESGFYILNKDDFFTLLVNCLDKNKLIEFSKYCNLNVPNFLKIQGTKIEPLHHDYEVFQTETLSPIFVTRNKGKKKDPIFLTDEILQEEVNKILRQKGYTPNVRSKIIRSQSKKDTRISKHVVEIPLKIINICKLQFEGDCEQIAAIRFYGLGRKKGFGYGCIK